MAARSPSNTCTLTPGGIRGRQAERAVSDQPTSSLARGFRCNADIHPAFATPFTSCRFNVSHCRLRGAPNGPLTHPMHRLHTQRTAHTPNAPLTHPTHHSHPQCTTHTPNAPLTHPMHHSHTQRTTHIQRTATRQTWLVVGGGGERLLLPDWDRRVARNQHRHDTSRRLNSERQRRHIHQHHVCRRVILSEWRLVASGVAEMAVVTT